MGYIWKAGYEVQVSVRPARDIFQEAEGLPFQLSKASPWMDTKDRVTTPLGQIL